jgi:hypothetical protein
LLMRKLLALPYVLADGSGTHSDYQKQLDSNDFFVPDEEQS